MPTQGLQDVAWRISYRTSSQQANGQPVDILHDFYLPALQRAVRYDRVAGYFRSTSLAAASQGFSAFVGRQGRVRLIVGADLAPQDVQAILDGTEERLAAALNAELAHPEAWPAEVTRGVELLAWMVARGYLEVRVAFRVHAATGVALAIDALEDGYVHMKWAVFADAHGHRLYASGSLNESRTALVRNAENIDVHCDWRGDSDRQRVEEAAQEFETLWDNRNPSLRVLSLPDAVRQRLLTLAAGVTRALEIDGSSAVPLAPSALERLRFALLRDGPRLPGGRYVGMATAPVAPWPHQAVVARRLIDTWPYSYLLCDEVGLGKTIEAGLAIRSLYLAGLVQRVLICAPASLTRQWQREMAAKFLLPFGRARRGPSPRHSYLLPMEAERTAASIYAPDLVIVSTGLVARQERRGELEAAQDFDITLVDEAHYARRRNPTQGSRAEARYGHLYTTLQQDLRPKSRCLLLATATPMQLDLVEVADLLQLTRRGDAFQRDPGLLRAYYELLGRLVRGQRLSEREWEFLRRAVLAIRHQDPVLWAFIQNAVIDPRTRFAAQQWLERGRIARGPDLQGIQRLIFAAAPLSRVMLRHTRSLLDIYRAQGRLGANLARRHILPMPRILFTDQERQAYDQLEAYCQGLAQQMIGQGSRGNQNAVGFLLSFLRLRFASSLFAIRETLRRRLQRVEAAIDRLRLDEATELDEVDVEDLLDEGDDDTEAVRALLTHRQPADLQWERHQLQAMLATLSDLSGPSSKMTELLRVLSQRRLEGSGRFQQTVIFTRFYDTLTDLRDRLLRASPGMRLGTYAGRGGQDLEPQTGRLVEVDREVVKHRFLQQQIDILVCTDAAAEGLNLQTADLLVNFDLPWNPMKVEQRIGRIDRIGQQHADIYVLNLCYLDSVEEIVYGRLLQRLADVEAVMGTQRLSLLPVTREEFQQLAAKTLTEAELEYRATERARQAHHRTASMEMPPQDLYRTYLRLEQQQDYGPVPVDLDAIWETLSQSSYLRSLGCRVAADEERRILLLANLTELPDGTAVTTSRATFDVGVAAMEGRLHFATYGDPAFEALLAHTDAFDLPGCIRRLEIDIPDMSVKVVGYAVASLDGAGHSACRLVTSMHELATLQLHEAGRLTDADVEPLRHALAARARTICQTVLTVPQVAAIEVRNDDAAWSQLALDYIVIRGIIQARQRTKGAAPQFWREIADLEDIFQEQDRCIRVQRIPRDHAQSLSGRLLFDLTMPDSGDDGRLDAPRPLLHAALDAAHRLATSMRVKKSELATDAFVTRLHREIETILKRRR